MSCQKNSKNLTMAEVMGGLGNQMFIYAFARAQQLQFGGRCVLVARGDGPVAHCALGLESLCISPAVELCRDPDAMKKTLPLQNALRALALRHESRAGLMNADHSAFERRVRPVLNRFGAHLATEGYLACRRPAHPRALLAWGYFQSETYFAPFADTLRAELMPRTVPQSDFSAALAAVNARGGRTVCVHVRRGDYLRPENAALRVCTLGYYRRAMAAARAALPGCTFVFFSDDMPWVRENLAQQADPPAESGAPGVSGGSGAPAQNLPGSAPKTAADPAVPPDPPALFAPAGGSAAGDLALMAQCTDFILSNSTFSWWGQYLSTAAAKNVENLPKQVFAPDRWYANQKTTALYQKFWRLVPTTEDAI